ncbi:ScbA/BarX family gamma-butyrolactone biosynthesis protein [Streptomyces tagetis]|uniref:ScbA protein n=1 Tax=Streptomyces tagetis TaxID=2820809 RepID=A0A940XHB3_9ACTN|nr:ScbA/BarX family gamma-butyrolactone biosynthesis protein [Streptomyces sp. RG38]MBQ0827177.1 ScbA protein [Streptomyces sp. RG38]
MTATATEATTQLAATRPPALPALPVDRALVHRRHLHDVLPTGVARHSDTHFGVTARWPRHHALYTTPDGHHSPSLVLETIRQGTLLLSHAHLGVPLGHHFILQDLSHHLDPVHLTRTPRSLTLDIRVTHLRRRGPVPVNAALAMTLHIDGRPAGTGSIRFTITTPAAYQRIRGHLPTTHDAPPTPHGAPHTPTHEPSHPHALLTPTPQPSRWLLHTDPANHHPLIDRPNDHLPATLLIEAAQQAAHLAAPQAHFAPTTSHLQFTHYVEPHAPCWITAHRATRHDTTTVTTTGYQEHHAEPAFTIRYTQPATPH